MSTTEQYLEVMVDYGGVEGDANYIAVMKGDVVRLIKKDKEWITIEKEGHIGKVPKRILVQKLNLICQIPMNLPIQTAQPSPQIMNSMSTQNDKEPIKSMIPIDKQKSQVIPSGQKEQTEQQSDNLLQSITNLKSHSGSGSSKSKRKYKAPKYQLDLLDQIMKDIHSIIESETINDEEKEIKIRKIYNELKKKDEYELRKIFNIDAFKLIKTYINDCKNRIEKILLDIIELVVEHGIQKYQENDPMFNDIQSSNLFDKIKWMIKNQNKKEKEQKKYSNETEQLIRIYIQILKRRQSDQQMIDICANVIEKNIINLLNIINKLKEKDNKGNKNEQENEEIERQIKQSAKLIKVISLIEEKDPNNEWKTRIPDQIIKIMKERICPLIHLNCPPDINCQQYINISHSPALIELKSDVFQILAEVSNDDYEFVDLLRNDHNTIPHLTNPLIQFVSQYQFNKKTDSQEQHDQQQSESSSSNSLITSSIKFLESLIMDNNNNRQELINTPKALHSLITLSSYKINIRFSQENNQQTFAVRHRSRGCLGNIQEYGDAYIHSELVNARYVRVLIIAISTASGSDEEYDEEIFQGLYRISIFLKCLYQGTYSFPPQPLLVRRSDEQIEEEGGNEEIDSQLINKGYRDNIKNSANEAIGRIINYFIEWGNQRPYWYNW